MRIASFKYQDKASYGIVDDGHVRPVTSDCLNKYPDLKGALAADACSHLTVGEPLSLDRVEFLPVISSPGKIICVGMNYLEHIREMGREPPAYPTLFTRFADTLVGHQQALVRPRLSSNFDYEGELGVVIGHPARHAKAASALQYIAGYTCFMDGSIRDYQRQTSQFTAGKNFRHSGACGPWLVTSDEIPDPNQLTIETRLNGQTMQTGRIDDLCFGIGALIEYLSGICQLEPGDIIATGTPGGVGFARDPQVWLQPGDTLEIDISQIGVLKNKVTDEHARP
ncbi:MAG: fumarylacetoacetate hydrolase family protein [Gammaproteobacteria bacterium]|nr:fumarylacetoacetate hydrolase family protein [Gammaproteobacteria bacterium]